MNNSSEKINPDVGLPNSENQAATDEKKVLTANPGDRISDEPQSIEEKQQQLAVDAPDITGEHLKVPTYFVVDEPDGQKKALHHVKDAEEISDVIRLARVDENGDRMW